MSESEHVSDRPKFIMVARTSAIDRLILAALERGVDTVLNLGAELDTRPYRLALPAPIARRARHCFGALPRRRAACSSSPKA